MNIQSQNISRRIVLCAVIVALTLLASFLPYVFLVPLLFVAVSFGFFTTMFAALSFGLISLALSFTGGATFVPLVFIEYPIIPIVPRLLAGAVAYLSYIALNRLIKKEGNLKTYLPKAIAAGVGSAANTGFVLLFMYLLVSPDKLFGGMSLKAFSALVAIPATIEVFVTVIVVPPLAVAVRRALKHTKFASMLSGAKVKFRTPQTSQAEPKRMQETTLQEKSLMEANSQNTQA